MNLSSRSCRPLTRWSVAAAAVIALVPVATSHAVTGQAASTPSSAPVPAALSAAAATPTSQAKLSSELRALTASPWSRPTGVTWARWVRDRVMVKVLIVASSTDPELASLRADVLAHGGSVFYNYLSVRALAVMVPASALATLAARSDVVNIAPNRPAWRQSSLLQASSRAGDALIRDGAVDGLDGRGVGIAVLDSGIDYRHRNFTAPDGSSRVRGRVDFVALGRSLYGDGWGVRGDYSASTRASIDWSKRKTFYRQHQVWTAVPDPFGHGTAVASVAAGSGDYQAPDSSGIATGATLYDVRVLDENGVGNMADVLAGIDWVIQRAKLANIRVMNLSLGASSTDSFLVDPLARAARSAVATGIVVVASAGNAGKDEQGREVFGAVSSPGNEPSVITVGASNMRDTPVRKDDVVTSFSSRGPTRGGFMFTNGNRWVDNLIKPDLVAPGNKVLTAMATNASGQPQGWNTLARTYPQLTDVAGAQQAPRQTLMTLSGTSMAAPTVAGAVAVLLQANPGLTPPLVKALLQYSATPLADASLLQQGTGLLNVRGAVRLARALRTDIAAAVEAGTLKAGDNLLAHGKTLPQAANTEHGNRVNWSRMAYAGGTHLVSGEALFTTYQPIWDPTLTWARHYVLKSTVNYHPASKWGAVGENRVPRSIAERNASAQPLLTGGVRLLDAVAPSIQESSSILLAPLTTLVDRASAGGGLTLSLGFDFTGKGIQAEGFLLSEGFVLSEGIILREGIVLNEGIILREGFVLNDGIILREGFIRSEGIILREGFVLNEGIILRESAGDAAVAGDSSLLGD